MTEENQDQEQNNLPALSDLYQGGVPANQEAFDDMTKGGNWLPRLIICNAMTKQVKNPSLKFDVGNFALVFDEETANEFGTEIDFLPLAWRYTAMATKGDVVAYHNVSSPEFKDIQAKADAKVKNHFYGPEFLGVELGTYKICTFLFGGKSSRPAGKPMRAIFESKKVAHMVAKEAHNEDGDTWFKPVVTESDADAALPQELVTKVMDEIKKFMNAPDGKLGGTTQGETVTDDSDERAR